MSSSMPGGYPEIIRECGKLGFDGVELDVGADYADNMLWQAPGRREIARLLASADIGLASVCLGTFWTYSFASPEAGVRERARGFTGDAIQWCAELGARAILVPITPGSPEEGEEAPRRWIEELRKCAPLAERNEVFLAIENVGRGCGKTADALLKIVEGVGSPYVQVYYDFGNGLSLGGDPVAEIGKLGKRIVQVHAKDPGGQYLGEGRLDMKAVSAALKGIGYGSRGAAQQPAQPSYLVLETPATDDPPAAAARNLAFLRANF
jgi:sugar phosphate isomerase/epimerase